jgi:hypothetical protein
MLVNEAKWLIQDYVKVPRSTSFSCGYRALEVIPPWDSTRISSSLITFEQGSVGSLPCPHPQHRVRPTAAERDSRTLLAAQMYLPEDDCLGRLGLRVVIQDNNLQAVLSHVKRILPVPEPSRALPGWPHELSGANGRLPVTPASVVRRKVFQQPANRKSRGKSSPLRNLK